MLTVWATVIGGNMQMPKLIKKGDLEKVPWPHSITLAN
jgi:hypothetical protein